MTPLPCDVAAVFDDKCNTCHGEPPDFGAPMPLVLWEDTQVTLTGRDEPVWMTVDDRVHSTALPMPPGGFDPLTPAELATLEAWFAAGAPPGDATCP